MIRIPFLGRFSLSGMFAEPIRLFFLCLLCLVLFFNGCNNDENNPAGTSSGIYSEEDTGEISAGNAKYLVIRNKIGSLYLNSPGSTSHIGLRLVRAVNAKTRQMAIDRVNLIKLSSSLHKDTLFISIVSPGNQNDLFYSAALELTLPSSITLAVTDTLGGEFVSTGFSGRILVKNGNGVTLKKQKGSCSINSREGDIYIDMVLPAKGYCIAATGAGNVELRIPDTTNSLIDARTGKGRITYSELTSLNVISHSDTTLKGSMGSATGEIVLKSGIGNISIAPPDSSGE